MKNPLGRVVFKQGDVSNEKDCKDCMDLAYKEFKQLDILINNAGIMLSEDDKPDNTPLSVYK